VHPTQLYESVSLFVMTAALIALRRRGAANHVVFGWYLVAAGTLRFLIELVRVNEVVFLGLTTAQLFSAAIIAVGVWLLVRRSSEPRLARSRKSKA